MSFVLPDFERSNLLNCLRILNCQKCHQYDHSREAVHIELAARVSRAGQAPGMVGSPESMLALEPLRY
jgi:hypothetical protein